MGVAPAADRAAAAGQSRAYMVMVLRHSACRLCSPIRQPSARTRRRQCNCKRSFGSKDPHPPNVAADVDRSRGACGVVATAAATRAHVVRSPRNISRRGRVTGLQAKKWSFELVSELLPCAVGPLHRLLRVTCAHQPHDGSLAEVAPSRSRVHAHIRPESPLQRLRSDDIDGSFASGCVCCC